MTYLFLVLDFLKYISPPPQNATVFFIFIKQFTAGAIYILRAIYSSGNTECYIPHALALGQLIVTSFDDCDVSSQKSKVKVWISVFSIMKDIMLWE